jgi:hypothetical protein
MEIEKIRVVDDMLKVVILLYLIHVVTCAICGLFRCRFYGVDISGFCYWFCGVVGGERRMIVEEE